MLSTAKLFQIIEDTKSSPELLLNHFCDEVSTTYAMQLVFILVAQWWCGQVQVFQQPVRGMNIKWVRRGGWRPTEVSSDFQTSPCKV